MKIIDLLNKKRNDEELPKKFKYDDNVFVYDNEKNDYIYEHGNISFFNDYCSPIYDFGDCLATFDKEIEIIEEVEDKEYEDIEELNLDKDELLKKVVITAQDYVIEDKINALIRNQKYILERLDK